MLEIVLVLLLQDHFQIKNGLSSKSIFQHIEWEENMNGTSYTWQAS